MRTLFIDTHLYDIKIILFEDTKIIKSKEVKNKKYNSIYLMPAIKDVCENEDFDQIVVVNGPGSFTGVRLGLTIAKTLAYTMNKIIKPVTYFDLMNFSSDNQKHIFGISDQNGYFIGEFENNKKIKDFYYLSNSEFQKTDLKVETDILIDYKKVLNNLDKIESVNPHAVKPIYIKLIGVEQ